MLARPWCSKAGEWAWKAVNSVFDSLPLAAVLGGKLLCLHGGISSRLRSLAQLDRISRPLKLDQQIPGLLTDILWSDPFDGIKGTRWPSLAIVISLQADPANLGQLLATAQC